MTLKSDRRPCNLGDCLLGEHFLVRVQLNFNDGCSCQSSDGVRMGEPHAVEKLNIFAALVRLCQIRTSFVWREAFCVSGG